MTDPGRTTSAGVTYQRAEEGYFEKRSLTRAAGVWGLWGLGVAAVISGDFSGWNFGLATSGWGGMVIAFVIVVVMYFAMLFSIGEMSAAMPHTGGAYSFARAAMGPWGGFVTGLAETIEYVATTAVIVYFSAGYANGITSVLFGLELPTWVWWIVLYAIFIALNSAGAAISFRFAVVVAIVSIAILAVFAIVVLASGQFSVANLFDVEPDAGASAFLPHGLFPVLLVMPFAMWFFLGIEELPLAAEEAHDPARDIPRAGIIGMITLVICGAVVLVLNPGVNGSTALSPSGEPLLEGFRAVLPDELAAVLSAFALIGLLASLQGIMFAYGRNMYSLSRAGYYPRFLSLTGKRQTPYVALLAGAVIGFVALVIVDLTGGATGSGGAIVVNIAVWGAVLSYMLQMVSFVILRRRFPNAKRPYTSPVGVPGAVVAGIIALAVFIGFLLNPPFLPAIGAIAVLYVIMLVVFALVGRNRLVLSPEEEYALSNGMHNDPQAEDFSELEKQAFEQK